jgi:hypothetical protein
MKVSNEDRLQGCRFEGTYEIEDGMVVWWLLVEFVVCWRRFGWTRVVSKGGS